MQPGLFSHLLYYPFISFFIGMQAIAEQGFVDLSLRIQQRFSGIRKHNSGRQ